MRDFCHSKEYSFQEKGHAVFLYSFEYDRFPFHIALV